MYTCVYMYINIEYVVKSYLKTRKFKFCHNYVDACVRVSFSPTFHENIKLGQIWQLKLVCAHNYLCILIGFGEVLTIFYSSVRPNQCKNPTGIVCRRNTTIAINDLKRV